MTHQQHILLAFGTYSDCNVRLMINAPKFVSVTEMLQGSSFPLSLRLVSVGSISTVAQDKMNFIMRPMLGRGRCFVTTSHLLFTPFLSIPQTI